MKTRRELITEVLRRIRVVGSLVEPSSEDFARLRSIYGSKLEEWRDRKLVYWGNTGDDVSEIPTRVFDTLVDLMINVVETSYGRGQNVTQLDRRVIEDRLLRLLRRVSNKKSAEAPTRAEYY